MKNLFLTNIIEDKLPYDSEIEYLESTGTQYIDADILLHSTTTYKYSFEFKCYYPVQNNINTLFNCMNETSGSGYPGECVRYEQPDSSGNRINYSSNGTNTGQTMTWNGPFYLDTTFVAKGGRYGTYTAHNTPTTIFSSWRNNAPFRFSTMKLYYFKLTNNDVLVRDFIPVRKGNTGYLYDKVTGTLFGNKGTGSFIIGGDVKTKDKFLYQYLTFIPSEDATFSFLKNGTGNDIEYSIDNGTWTSLPSETSTPTVLAGHSIRWRGELTASENGDDTGGIGRFSATGYYEAQGNIMSLISGDNFTINTDIKKARTFLSLFKNDTHIQYAHNLIVYGLETNINGKRDIFSQMFYGCTSLISAPDLPFTTVANGSYFYMFYGCTSLIRPPKEIPLWEMGEYTCYAMFQNCTSMTTPVEMPNLTKVGAWSCTTMYDGCTSLLYAPELYAIIIDVSCYHGMFSGCTSMVYPPSVLPAPILISNCYKSMFYGCSALVIAPLLPAATMVLGCYQYMFAYCRSLTHVECMARYGFDASNPTQFWLGGTPNNSNCIFVKYTGVTDWTRDANGIPSNWTVNETTDYEEYDAEYDAEVEYLYSEGYQAINTEFVGTGYDEFEVDVAVNSLENPRGNYPFWHDVFGASKNTRDHKHYLALLKAKNVTTFPAYYYNTYNVTQYTFLQPTTFDYTTIRQKHKFKGKVNDIYIDGTLNHPSENSVPSPNLEIPYYLFANNVNNQIQYPSYIKIYMFKLWDKDGNLVRDMIPVRKNNVGYMYDRVTHKLYGNIGQGSLGVGPDIS